MEYWANTLVQKRNSSHLELNPIQIPRGVQGGYKVRWNTQLNSPKKIPFTFLNAFLQARSFFLGRWEVLPSILNIKSLMYVFLFVQNMITAISSDLGAVQKCLHFSLMR